MKAVVAAFNQEKALVGAFSVIKNLRMELFEALAATLLLLSAPSRDKISVVVKILPAANIRRRDAAETRRKAIAY